jgi:hypothetical protein
MLQPSQGLKPTENTGRFSSELKVRFLFFSCSRHHSVLGAVSDGAQEDCFSAHDGEALRPISTQLSGHEEM